jgi:hypothetical protein
MQSDHLGSEIDMHQDMFLFKVHFDKDGAKFLLQSPKASAEEINLADNIAVLNRETSNALSEIVTFCTFEAYSTSNSWTSFLGGIYTDEKSNYVLVDIVLYGPPEQCIEVGDILNGKKVYLQEPDYWQPGLKYMNPHFLDLDAVQPDSHSNTDPLSSSLLQMGISFQSSLSEEQATNQKLLKQKIAAAFKGMTRAQNLKRITADIRIRTPLLESVAFIPQLSPELICFSRYQEKALDFIMQRESGPIGDEYCLWKPRDKQKTL